MEYALRLEAPERLPADPREGVSAPLAGLLPEGRLVALYFGSEFCPERLPAVAEGADFCAAAAARGLEATLLTPPVTAAGLARVAELLAGLKALGHRVAVVFNDWGVLGLLEQRFSALPRRAGRLLNRTLRDPRALPAQGSGAAAPPEPRGRRLRAFLVHRGVSALETDPDLEGGYLGGAGEGLQRALHLPFAFVTSGRNCLLKRPGNPEETGLTAELGQPCRAPCRGGPLPVIRPDTAVPLWRAGNTLFYRVPEALATVHLAEADRVVLHRRPAA